MSSSDCGCLKYLDELRLRHEEGKVRRMAVFVEDVEGLKFWGHKVDPTLLFTVAKSAIDIAEGQLEAEMGESHSTKLFQQFYHTVKSSRGNEQRK